MRLLLDTHVAIWAATQSDLLPTGILSTLAENPDETFVSSMSVLEIAVKHRLRRADSPPFGGEEARGYFDSLGFRFLAVTELHAAVLDTLPLHHNDPFDRIMVAQAIVEDMHLVTRDAAVTRYSCPRLPWR